MKKKELGRDLFQEMRTRRRQGEDREVSDAAFCCLSFYPVNAACACSQEVRPEDECCFRERRVRV